MKKVAFHTLGCKLNYAETSSVARAFEDKGFEKVDFNDQPDIFVINTCSVTENANKKFRAVVKEARKISPDAFIAIMGCYAQLKPFEVATVKGVDVVLGASQKFKLLELVEKFEKQPETLIFAEDIDQATQFNSSWSINDRTRTFLKIQDGCDYACTFCTIPLARGKSRSDNPVNIVKKAIEIGNEGVKEIVLTGINTGDYGIINGVRQYNFFDLIQELEQVNTVERFRISSIEPNLLSNEIINFVSDSKRFMPHFHIPLQSGSDTILKKMRRRYLTALYSSRIETIKQKMPDACIGVDVIVGFPGETEEEFKKTYRFLSDANISYLHVFSYSERENTLAAEMNEVVPPEERARRSKMLRILSNKKRRSFYESQLGKTMKVLFEKSETNEGMMEGFTENYVRIEHPYNPDLINKVKDIKLQEITENQNVSCVLL